MSRTSKQRRDARRRASGRVAGRQPQAQQAEAPWGEHVWSAADHLVRDYLAGADAACDSSGNAAEGAALLVEGLAAIGSATNTPDELESWEGWFHRVLNDLATLAERIGTNTAPDLDPEYADVGPQLVGLAANLRSLADPFGYFPLSPLDQRRHLWHVL